MDSTALSTAGQPANLPALAKLAEQINEHHTKCVGAVDASLKHAIEAGRLLAEAKEQCKHGTWISWLKGNFAGSKRTAQVYMRVADRREEIEVKSAGTAHLGLDGALSVLASPKEAKATETPAGEHRRFADNPPEQNCKTCTSWWDILATHTLIYDAVGWSVTEIAEMLGMPADDVVTILDPRPPLRGINSHDREIFNDAFFHVFRDAVLEQITLILTNQYWAAEHRAEREGHPEVIGHLKMVGRQQRQQWERREGMTYALANRMKELHGSEWWWATYWLAADDAREALRIADSRGECLFDRAQEFVLLAKEIAA